MSLEKNIAEEMKVAMRAKDKVKLEALRSIKSAILMAKTDKGGGAEMSEADELKLLQKLQKQRKDSLEIYEQQNRQDLAQEERAQLEVIESFLPQQMGEDDLRAYVREVISRVNAAGPQDMGKVMGTANNELAGRADGKAISAIAREELGK